MEKEPITIQGFEKLKEFYTNADQLNDQERKKYFSTFWKNVSPTKSTFMKFRVFKEKVLIDIYRNDAKGGEYNLEKTLDFNWKQGDVKNVALCD